MCLRHRPYGGRENKVLSDVLSDFVHASLLARSEEKEERFERHPSSTFAPLNGAYDQWPGIVMNRCGSPAHLRLGEGSDDGSSGEREGRLRGLLYTNEDGGWRCLRKTSGSAYSGRFGREEEVSHVRI